MSQAPPRIAIRSSAAEWVVEAEAVRIGPDLLVYVWGGTHPHIGAVAAAAPRPSLADAERTSATASVLTYPGHKEDAVVKMLAETLAAALDAKVVVTAGIHWDGMPPQGIAAVMEHCREVASLLVKELGGSS